MLSKVLTLVLLGVAIKYVDAKIVTNYDVVDAMLENATYYNPVTGIALKGQIDRENYQLDDGRIHLTPLRIAFKGIPCRCEALSCECCAGINIQAINFNNRACLNFSYDSSEIAISAHIRINDKEIYANKLSARNPPPLCMPFPYFPAVQFCVRFFNISIVDKHLSTCVDFETRLLSSSVLVLHFNCVRIGPDGIQWQKPEELIVGQSQQMLMEIYEYDEVNFEQEDIDLATNVNETTLTEEESQVGQLKV